MIKMLNFKTVAVLGLCAFGSWGAYRYFLGERAEVPKDKPSRQQGTNTVQRGSATRGRRPVKSGTNAVQTVQSSSYGKGFKGDSGNSEDLKHESSMTRAIKALQAFLASDEFKSLPPSRQKMKHMRLALDGGEKHLALRYARELMDDDDPEVRHAALDTFGWIGMQALPEITEMLSDSDQSVADEALSRWSDIFQEIPEEVERAAILIDLVPTLKTQVEVDAALMMLTKMGAKTGIETTVKIIEGSTSLGSECARDMYEHLTGGEVYENPETAEIIVERILRLQNGENYEKVMKETGGEDLIIEKRGAAADGADESALTSKNHEGESSP